MASGRIRDEDVTYVRDNSAIDDVVGDFVQLKSAGGGQKKGLCPFHDEKSPSFHVTPSKGYFHCFGCGVGGDVIAFLMKMDHLSFSESVERLADRMGYTLRYDGTNTNTGPSINRSRLVAANVAAMNFYREQLNLPGSAQIGRDFLQKRGFDKAAAETFGVGYAPDEWDGLYKHLKNLGFTDSELSLAGLSKDGTKGPIDRYRNRLVWPIKDISGDVVGFERFGVVQRGLRGQHPRFGGAASVQGLGHRVHAKGLLQTGGKGAHRGQRVGIGAGRQAVQGGGRSGRAKAAHGAGVVPMFVVGAAQGGTNAGGYFIACHHGAQQVQARGLGLLGHRPGRGNGGCARVVNGFAVNVIKLHGVGRRAIDQRGGAGGGGAAQRQAGAAMVQVVGQSLLEQGGRFAHRAGQQGGVPVDDGALGMVQHLGGQWRGGQLRAISGQRFNDGHGKGGAVEVLCVVWRAVAGQGQVSGHSLTSRRVP